MIVLGLPKSTELNKQLPKKSIYEKFNMNTAAKDRFDADIKKLIIINEVSPTTINIPMGDNIGSFYVLLVTLKNDSFDDKNIALISRLINQKMIFVLEFEGKAKLAIYHTKLMQTKWSPTNELKVDLKGLNLDTVWENIIIQVGGIKIVQNNSIDEQLILDEKKHKILKQIEQLERMARTEKQPKKKFELAGQVQELKKELEVL
jgi:hypothetical protein